MSFISNVSISLFRLVKSNNGFYKSDKQKAFLVSQTNNGVYEHTSQISFGAFGGCTRHFLHTFIFDEKGVSRVEKTSLTTHKTSLYWERASKAQFAEQQKKHEEEKNHREKRKQEKEQLLNNEKLAKSLFDNTHLKYDVTAFTWFLEELEAAPKSLVEKLLNGTLRTVNLSEALKINEDLLRELHKLGYTKDDLCKLRDMRVY